MVSSLLLLFGRVGKSSVLRGVEQFLQEVYAQAEEERRRAEKAEDRA